jgi:DnaJ domain
MPKAKDPYLVLGVPRGAGIDEVKRAYRRLVLALHPDQNKEIGTVDRLRDVQHAYETLQEPEVRRDLWARVPPPTADDGDNDVPVRRRPTDRIEGEPKPEPLTYSTWPSRPLDSRSLQVHPKGALGRHLRPRHATAHGTHDDTQLGDLREPFRVRRIDRPGRTDRLHVVARSDEEHE